MQQLPAGVDGALGELQAAHVVLGEDDVAVRALGEQVLEALLALAHARVVACMRPLLSTTPARTRPASRSTTPEPQMPMGSAPAMVCDVGGRAVGRDA